MNIAVAKASRLEQRLFGQAAVGDVSLRRWDPRMTKWAFMAYMASLPFEFASIFEFQRTGNEGILSLNRLALFALVGAAVVEAPKLMGGITSATWLFALMVFGGTLLDFWGGRFDLSFCLVEGARLLVMVGIFGIASSLGTDPHFVRRVLAVFGFGGAILGVLALFGFADVVFREESLQLSSAIDRRVTILGEDPNFAAVRLVLALVLLTSLAVARKTTSAHIKLAAFCFAICLLPPIVRTGSRTGLLCLLAGIVLVALVNWEGRLGGRHALIVTLVFGLITYTGYLALQSDSVISRMLRVYDQYDTAGRFDILAASAAMIAESPVVGYGTYSYQLLLGATTGAEFRSSHNIITGWAMASSPLLAVVGAGVLGATMWRLWQRRSQPVNKFILPVFGCMLISGMALDIGNSKLFWTVFGLAMGINRFAVVDVGRSVTGSSRQEGPQQRQ